MSLNDEESYIKTLIFSTSETLIDRVIPVPPNCGKIVILKKSIYEDFTLTY